MALVDPVKPLENPCLMLRRYAYSRVRNSELRRAADTIYIYVNLSALAVIFYRVVAEVVYHFVEQS